MRPRRPGLPAAENGAGVHLIHLSEVATENGAPENGAGVHLIHLSEVAKGSKRKCVPADQDYLHFIRTQVFTSSFQHVIFCNTTNSLHV